MNYDGAVQAAEFEVRLLRVPMMAGELVGLAIQLAICVAIGVALLRFVPLNASRSWAAGLLVFGVLANLGPVIGVVVAYFSPPSFYMDTENCTF